MVCIVSIIYVDKLLINSWLTVRLTVGHNKITVFFYGSVQLFLPSFCTLEMYIMSDIFVNIKLHTA